MTLRRQINELLNDGVDVDAIVERLGCSRRYANQVRQVHPSYVKPPTQAERHGDEVRRLRFEEGMSVPKIAARLGVSQGFVYNVISQVPGYESHSSGRRPIELDEDYIRSVWHDLDVSIAQMSAHLGVCYETVARVASGMGLPSRSELRAPSRVFVDEVDRVGSIKDVADRHGLDPGFVGMQCRRARPRVYITIPAAIEAEVLEHVERGAGAPELSEEFEVTEETARRWLELAREEVSS